MINSCCRDNLPVCILHLGKNGLEKYHLAKKWEQFKIVLLFMDHPVCDIFLEMKMFRRDVLVFNVLRASANAGV